MKERFSDRQRSYRIIVVSGILSTVLAWPNGIINYQNLESENILVAGREGAANCTTTLMLKQSGRFKMRSICFGVEDDLGTYSIYKDTVKLNYTASRGATDKFKYAILDSTKMYLRFYKDKAVTAPYLLRVTLNKTKLH